MWTILGTWTLVPTHKLHRLSKKQVCEKLILLQRNRYFKRLRKPAASFSAVCDRESDGTGSLALVGEMQGPTCLSCFLWPICRDLPFSWELANPFWNTCCIYTCRQFVREGLLQKHFFLPSEILSHTGSLAGGGLRQQSFWSKWCAFICFIPYCRSQRFWTCCAVRTPALFIVTKLATHQHYSSGLF